MKHLPFQIYIWGDNLFVKSLLHCICLKTFSEEIFIFKSCSIFPWKMEKLTISLEMSYNISFLWLEKLREWILWLSLCSIHIGRYYYVLYGSKPIVPTVLLFNNVSGIPGICLKMSEFHSHWRSPSDNLMKWLVRLGSIR